MRLKLLKLTNCLGIEEKEIKIGKITLIDGESESGKTSIIDSIRKGLKNENVRPKFVNGEKDGIVFMQFDEDFEVTRKVKPDNRATLKITKDGMTPQTPQTYLNSLLGENDFAPIDWLKKNGKEQAEDLLKLLPIKVTAADIEKLTGEKVNVDYNKHGLTICDEIEKHFMETRKDVNADVKAYKINIEDAKTELPAGYDPKKYLGVKLNDLFTNISEAEETNNLINRANARIENSKDTIENFEEEYQSRLDDLKAEFERRKKELLDTKNKKVQGEEQKTAAAKEYIKENKMIDTKEMKDHARDIEEGQSYLRLWDKLAVSQDEYTKWNDESKRLTDIITKIRELPTKLLAEAKSPIAGLGVKGGSITIDGLPINNLSDGAKMRLAIKVAKETSKELKLILLNGFEQLNWKLQKEMFKEMQDDEYQYIITRVTDGELTVSHIQNDEIVNTETGETIELK